MTEISKIYQNSRYASNVASLDDYGAVGDGVTDDLAAFNLAIASGKSPIRIPAGTYSVSTPPVDESVVWLLDLGAEVVPVSGNWNPRHRIDHGDTELFGRKVNPINLNPTVPPEFYALLPESYQKHDFWINQFGYQEKDTDGNYSGSATPGKIPGGQTRMARTGSEQLYLQGSHAGFGDAYNQFSSMAVTQHAETNLVTWWSGQNSGGLYNAQINAVTDKVNLYGHGDVSLVDKGFTDVSQLGYVLFLAVDGADSGDYGIPRFAYYAENKGVNDADCAYITRGKFFQGSDFSGSQLSSNSAVTLTEGQRISFDATPVSTSTDGKFSSVAVGDYWIDKSGSSMQVVADGQSVIRAFQSRAEIFPLAQSSKVFRVHGNTASAYAAIGQFGTSTYVSAVTSGTDSTVLRLSTALAGVESEQLVIKSSGVVSTPNMPTYADDAAAGVGGLAAKDWYQTATGELRIKL